MNNHDTDSVETREWLDALKSVAKYEGVERAQFLLKKLSEKASALGISTSQAINTPYINTIPPSAETRISNIIRWNALVTVLKATQKAPELGGHLASYASAAVLYEVGFNHFFHGPTETHSGDLVYIQGHSSPGIYARAFLEGRITEEQLRNFRQEVGVDGLSSYPHPW